MHARVPDLISCVFKRLPNTKMHPAWGLHGSLHGSNDNGSVNMESDRTRDGCPGSGVRFSKNSEGQLQAISYEEKLARAPASWDAEHTFINDDSASFLKKEEFDTTVAL